MWGGRPSHTILSHWGCYLEYTYLQNIFSTCLVAVVAVVGRSETSIPRIVWPSSKLETFLRIGLAIFLKYDLCESLAFLYLKKFIRKIKNYHTNGTSMVGLYNSATNTWKFQCETRPRMNFSKIGRWNFETNISSYQSGRIWPYNNFLNWMKIIAVRTRTPLCWGNCVCANSDKINSHADQMKRIKYFNNLLTDHL